MKNLLTQISILLCSIIILAACTPTSSPADPIPKEGNMTPTSEALPPKDPNNTLPTDAEAQNAVELAQKSLATKLDIGVEEITFVSYQSKEWPDGSMGCSQVGEVYTDVETSGYIIRLQVVKDVYNYHGGLGKLPFLCQSKPQK